MIEIKLADSFLKRLLGFMFRKESNYGLLFTNLTDTSIHTCFMRFEIDIYFINKEKIVVDKTTLKPWKYYRTKKEVKYILETKKNLLNIKIGEKLDFIQNI